MNYELAKKLKDAGFLQTTFWHYANFTNVGEYDVYKLKLSEINLVGDTFLKWAKDEISELKGAETVAAPTLSELIEQCGEDFSKLEKVFAYGVVGWEAISNRQYAPGQHYINGKLRKTPEEAVANLWLALNT